MSSASSQRHPDSADSPSTPQNARQPSYQYDSYQPDRRRMRRSSTTSLASITSSIGGTLDTAAQSSAEFSDLSQNAISSLLSHPIVRTGLVPQSALSVPTGHRAPSIRDIPPVHLTPIPHVETSAFKAYLSGVGQLFDTYQRSKASSEEADVVLSPRPRVSSRPDYFNMPTSPSPSESVSATPTPLRAAALLSPSPGTMSPRHPRGSPKRRPQGPTPLSTIPNIYFEENFQLENPRTFDVVSEKSDVIPPDPFADEVKGANGAAKAPARTGRKALHTNAIIQEKLSWYMDTVEVHLIQSIAMASHSFFAALGSLKDLQSEATESIEKIKDLREALKQLDQEMALGGLEVVKLKRRRENLRKLGNAVKQLCEVMDEATACEELVEQDDLDGAVARLDALEDLIAGKSSRTESPGHPNVDLRKLKAIGGLSEGISQLRIRIGKGYEVKFIDALLSDLRQHVESVPPRETMQRWANATLRVRGEQNKAKSTSPAYLKTNPELRPNLLAALAGLNKSGQTAKAAVAYREAVMKEIKSLIRRYLPSSSDDDAESINSISTRGGGAGRRLKQQEKSVILARNLRALDPESAEELLVKVYTSVGEALRRMGVQVKVVLDVTSNVEQPDTKGAPRRSADLGPSEIMQMRDEVNQALDMTSLLGQAVDVTQTQVTKVLKVRNEQNAKLSLKEFLRYFILNRLFTDECEAVSGRGSESLKEVVNSQVKDFLAYMASAEQSHIVQTLEADQWDAKEFPPEEQAVLDRILESMNRTPKAWLDYVSLWEEEAPTNGTPALNGSSADPPTKSRFAKVEEQTFVMVFSTISAVHGIETYLNLMAAIPSLTTDCSMKLLEYLKTFNSRCCQLILGAGATRSAGLKNITTKHLALASQTCSFLIALVPYMREFVRRHAGTSASAVLPEFDKVKRSIQDHQNSIHEKLVDIMSARSNVHVASMKKIDWDAAATQENPNPYVETLAKETGTLYRVLSRHVAEIDLQMIMVPIFSHYNQEWIKAFEGATVKTEAGKQCMIRDLEYLDSRFAKIESSGDFVKNLIELVKAKEVEVVKPPPAPAAPVPDPAKTPNGPPAEENEVMFEFTEPPPESEATENPQEEQKEAEVPAPEIAETSAPTPAAPVVEPEASATKEAETTAPTALESTSATLETAPLEAMDETLVIPAPEPPSTDATMAEEEQVPASDRPAEGEEATTAEQATAEVAVDTPEVTNSDAVAPTQDTVVPDEATGATKDE